MSAERRQAAGKSIWIVAACVLLMAANIAVNGWSCFGRRPGGSNSALLYTVLLAVSVPSLWGMFAVCLQVWDSRLRASLFFVCSILALAHVILTPACGFSIFTSAHGGMLYRYAAFLSAILVCVSPNLVRMSFSSR